MGECYGNAGVNVSRLIGRTQVDIELRPQPGGLLRFSVYAAFVEPRHPRRNSEIDRAEQGCFFQVRKNIGGPRMVNVGIGRIHCGKAGWQPFLGAFVVEAAEG